VLAAATEVLVYATTSMLRQSIRMRDTAHRATRFRVTGAVDGASL
jgi:hypothetical protein